MTTATIHLYIDNRERGLKLLVDNAAIDFCTVEYANLELGDIVIQLQKEGETIISLMFERKTFADLQASIQDGRYHHQKKRLLEKHTSSNVFYIIEGSSRFDNGDISLHSAIINTIVRDHIGVFRTRDINDTYALVMNVARKIHDTPEKYITTSNTQLSTTMDCLPPSAIACNKKESTYINMLCQIQGISLKTAKSIAMQYPSLHALISELSPLSDSEKLNKLKTISCTDKKGATRKISSSAVQHLIDEIFHGDADQNTNNI